MPIVKKEDVVNYLSEFSISPFHLDALSAPEARTTVVAFLQAVRADPQFDVVGYVPAVYLAGFDLFAALPDKDWSLTDCILFGVLTERKLSEALTANRHFEQAGFRAIFELQARSWRRPESNVEVD